ncbi:MAG: Crp/Fnr family transcriptional regulator [Gemmatimonadota bacterium]
MRRCDREANRVLAGAEPFAQVERSRIAELAARSICRRIGRGRILFREGGECGGLHVVVTGRIRVYRASRDGRTQVLYTAEAGDVLGEASVFAGGRHPASAMAVEASRVLFVPAADVRRLFDADPVMARAVVADVGRRLGRLADLVDLLVLHEVPERVAAALVEYAEERGAMRDGGEFELPGTQGELAAELGTTRESVARALGMLRERRAIEQRGGRVRVLDIEALRETAA